MNTNFKAPKRAPKEPLAQLIAALVGLLLLGAAFVFSVFFIIAFAAFGLAFGVYFWWKTRAVRAQLRAQRPPSGQGPRDPDPVPPNEGAVIEGEAIRVDEAPEK